MQPGYWGAWATLGWTILLFVLWSAAQAAGAFLYLGWRVIEDPNLLAQLMHPAGSQEALKDLAKNGFALALMTILSAPAAVFGAIFVCKLRGYFSPTVPVAEHLGLRSASWKQYVFWIAATQALAFAFGFLGEYLGRPETPDFVRDIYASAGSPLILSFAIVLCAPVAEEFLFRGFAFPGLARSRFGPALAILLPSLIWGGLHLQYDLFDITYVFSMGLLLGLARWKTESLYVPIAMHVYNNGMAMLSVAFLSGQN